MLTKNIFGILILLFNMVGLVYFLYLGTLALVKRIATKESTQEEDVPVPKKRTPLILTDNVIPDEDDLLKDMDLSDLDNLNLDDFE